MLGEREFVIGLILVISILFASNRIRLDIVAMLAVLALMLSGVLTVSEALAGFGDPVVVLVAGLLIVGEMLVRTGIAQSIGAWILRYGGQNETRLLVLIMLAAGVLGSIMSSTAVVAIFIPVVLRVAAKTNLNVSRLLLPMSYAALISGMLTLIATSPNLVVSGELVSHDYEPLGFFSFSPIGAAVLVVAISYILILGLTLLPAGGEPPSVSAGRATMDLWRAFDLGERIQRLHVGTGSSILGMTIGEAGIASRFGVRVLGIEHPGRFGKPVAVTAGEPNVEIKSEDVLIVFGRPDEIVRFREQAGLEFLTLSEAALAKMLQTLGAAVLLIHPECRLAGKSLRQSDFRSRHDVHVLGIRRGEESLADFVDVPLAAADMLFVAGPWSRITQLRNETHDFILLELPAEFEDVVPARKRAPAAILILTGMVLLSALDIVPTVAAVILAALAAVVTRCLTMEDAYRSIHWSSLVLLAGILPVGNALEKTGGVDLIVDSLLSGMGNAGPYAMMTALFFLTAVIGLFLSNTASAVLMAPVAIRAAQALGVSPYPFAVVVLMAASAAFITPVSTPVVTLIVQPGRYRFGDFVKLGIPLLLLTFVTVLILTPVFFKL